MNNLPFIKINIRIRKKYASNLKKIKYRNITSFSYAGKIQAGR